MNEKDELLHPVSTREKVFRVETGCWVLVICLLVWACQSSERRTAEHRTAEHQTAGDQTEDAPHSITSAFYHWKSTYSPTHSEQRQLNNFNVQKLYIHFFDVDWDGRMRRPVPKAFVRFRQKPIGSIVPVVFITNRTLTNLTAAGLPELASNITQTVTRIRQQNLIQFSELQVDCDWSLLTRDRYFRLLTLLARQLHCPLSATIRLHQIKYTDQTGIPPVSRGMLMLYNVADWKRADTRNSIYDVEVANQYLAYVAAYPLPLDVVLPLFRWTVVYRNNRFLTFLNNVDQKTLSGYDFLTGEPDGVRFVARRDTAVLGLSIRRGDLFRAETVAAETLLKEKDGLLRRIRNQRLTFALYHLDSTVLSGYSRETLQTLLAPRPLP